MTSALATDIVVPDSVLRKWQSIVDILARSSGFVSALVMRADHLDIEVFVSSRTDGNPYKRGERTSLNAVLYCKKVMAERGLFHCRNAKDPANPWPNLDADELNMVCYYGIPILRPDGIPFGTICILDRIEKDVSPDAKELIELFRTTIEDDLSAIVSNAERMRMAKADHREVEDRYAAVFQQAAVGIARVGMDGTWLEVNDKLCSIVGYSRAELEKTTFQNLTHIDDLDVDLENVDRLVRGEQETYSIEKRYVHKQGHQVWALLTVSLVRDEHGEPRYFISIVEDITEKKLLQRGVEQAQKLDAMGRLVGGIAHEFNNKLATITGNLFLASRNRANWDEYVDRALKLSFQASEMIKGLLTYARREPSERAPVRLDLFLKDMIKSMRLVYPENILLTSEVPTFPIIVSANTTQIQQIVLNLMNNARDAVETVQHPRVAFRIKATTSSPAHAAKHPDVAGASFALIEVEDNGVGIPAADQSKIFDPFFTTKPVGKGSGIGLAMVESLVQQHGGSVVVDSTPGRGSIFRVFLPLVTEPAASVDRLPRSASLHGTAATILVVDDDEMVLQITCEVLEMLGYRVERARHGAEALELYASGRQIDCVLTDVVMPNMGGAELFDRLKAINPDVKIVFMTGYNNTSPSTLQAPTLFKPVTPDTMNDTLLEVLGRSPN